MDKDRLLEALNGIQNGRDAEGYYDELETVIGIIMNTTDEAITAAWDEIHEDAETADIQN